jgi:hypothetical protein
MASLPQDVKVWAAEFSVCIPVFLATSHARRHAVGIASGSLDCDAADPSNRVIMPR